MAKRPMTPEDIFRFAYLGDAQISPDGKLVAYVHEHLEQEQDKALSEIWVVPAAGGPARKLTSGPRDRFPRWSPDGRRLHLLPTGAASRSCTSSRWTGAKQLTLKRRRMSPPRPSGRRMADGSPSSARWERNWRRGIRSTPAVRPPVRGLRRSQMSKSGTTTSRPSRLPPHCTTSRTGSVFTGESRRTFVWWPPSPQPGNQPQWGN